MKDMKEEKLHYPCSKNKGADQLGSLKLICAFVFTYVKRCFSHDIAHMSYKTNPNSTCMSISIIYLLSSE